MIKTKILFLSLSAIAILATVLGLSQIWTDLLDWDDFIKIIATLILLGTQISFLIAVDYDLPASHRKKILYAEVGLSTLACGLITVQIWAQIFQWVVFVKLLATLGIAILLLGFLLLVAEDFLSGKHMKDKNFID